MMLFRGAISEKGNLPLVFIDSQIQILWQEMPIEAMRAAWAEFEKRLFIKPECGVILKHLLINNCYFNLM